MGVSQRLKTRFRRFLQRPGTTVDLAPLEKLLPAIEAREEKVQAFDDAELTEAAAVASTYEEICALGREAARRGLDQRPYDVQLLGAMSLLSGKVAEMATGEGKTLTAAIAAYGHVRLGNGPVHVLTVNDYLARRDAQWMEPVYTLLGLTVGWVNEASTPAERRAAYACDVTYVAVSEAGFDFLRDQLVTDVADRVQPALRTAIVDEADSILIDEARVPMVLAGSVASEQDPVHAAAALVRGLRKGKHYTVAEDGRSVAFTSAGLAAVEAKLGIDLYDEENVEQLSAVNVALHAHALLHRDVDYIVRDGTVELIDEMRGRVAQRRRWPDGLQAAVEAKEGLDATAEGEVLGTIAVQAYIGLYPTVCGMTATAVLVGDQLREFFGLEVAVIPPNTPCVRVDEPDRIYATRAEKDEALVDEIQRCHAAGRPVLVGTLDVKESEQLAAGLNAVGVPCVVLNAKNDDEEAAIIAEAGAYGAVTVSTQMAGRGVDIRLGGSEQIDRERVAELGGLYVIGSGRHDSRRVDDQLRGRAGRQGDPGGSVFFVSLEDDLVARHAGDTVPPSPRMNADGLVTDPQVDYAVEHAQRVAEGVNHEIHRNTWRYSVVIEQQRKALAERRERLLTSDVAALMLLDKMPEKAGEMDEDLLARVARSIALYHLDRLWADHLAELSEVREGVHLRALGRLDPLDEFHRAAVPAFTDLVPEIEARTLATFAETEFDEDWEPDAAELVRPSATWTYLVHDNPFGSELDRLIASVGRRLSGGGGR
ncbi:MULTISPECIES: accessory Sec system translocase SecA2 [Micromonospora]|uniref:Protein translocase subunit SecA n=1 Tax=Micromonospora maris TaxID=1003110 RepID=A0A9X0I1K1_9ACTN|nr:MULTISPECIES: accessory Sec system translocase SecA2 [Micromonospora]AEB45732.1 preprotein translocase subunit SecA [Micromonospora maris AB-18-032]KUJ45077.1 accessory Sec system translocase SecA2 [Micromonospora maris]RUL94876.1 accessory Sec system translocase SecA2 [Verrucosispora sp. FIM060022]